MKRPVILVLASPEEREAIGAAIRAHGTYEVLVPDGANPDWQPSGPVDGILSSYSIDRDLGPVTVELPAASGDPIRVRTQGLTVGVKVSSDDPLADAIAVFDQFLLADAPTPITI